MSKFKKKYNLAKETSNISWPKIIYSTTLGLQFFQMLSIQASATTVWDKAREIFQDVYGQLVALSTIIAVVSAVVALLMMNFSKNGRTVDEARSWLKRIAITWAIINGLGFIMTYITPFFEGGKYTAT